MTVLAWALFNKAQAQDVSSTTYVMDITQKRYIAHKAPDSSWVITDPDAIMELNDYHLLILDSLYRRELRRVSNRLNALIRAWNAIGTKDAKKYQDEYMKLENENQ